MYILDSILHILAGAHAPSHHTIWQDILLQFRTQVESWNLNGTFLHLEVLIQLGKRLARIMMHTHDIIIIDSHICSVQHVIIRTRFSLHPNITVSTTWLQTQILYALSKMVPEYRTSRLKTIERLHNECTISSIISKIWTKHSPYLLSIGRIVMDIRCLAHMLEKGSDILRLTPYHYRGSSHSSKK
jgi:hypothetical protein